AEFQAAATRLPRGGGGADDFPEAMIPLWTKDPVAFDGEFYHIPEPLVGRKPVQNPHPPIYVAGFGQYTFDRAVKYGQGWNPSGMPTFEWHESMIKQFHDTAARAGRQPLEGVVP